MNKRIEEAQRQIEELALRTMAVRVMSECTRLAIRHAERTGRRNIDPARIDSLLALFGSELERQRKG